jgi:hypothetical protein
VTTLPTWARYVVGFGTPAAAFLGVLIGHVLLRRGANELDVWRRREETMRMLRWASDTQRRPTTRRLGWDLPPSTP